MNKLKGDEFCKRLDGFRYQRTLGFSDEMKWTLLESIRQLQENNDPSFNLEPMTKGKTMVHEVMCEWQDTQLRPRKALIVGKATWRLTAMFFGVRAHEYRRL